MVKVLPRNGAVITSLEVAKFSGCKKPHDEQHLSLYQNKCTPVSPAQS